MFEPINGKVLIKPEKPPEITPGGIVLLQNELEKPVTGFIQGDYVTDNLSLKHGQKVFFSKFAFDEVEIEKETYFLVSISNILGVFHSKEK